MKIVKKRKPRGYKKNGQKSYNLCLWCLGRACDPMDSPPKAKERSRNKLCPGCGHTPCTCKSSIELQYVGREVGTIDKFSKT